MNKVSIIIPCYNRERYISAAINSALQHTHYTSEVIVVDDGSTDGSWLAIASFGSRIKAVRIANSGVSQARNVGLDLATGDYIQFLDSDDLLCPDGLRNQIVFSQLYPYNQIIVGRATEFFDDGDEIEFDRYNINNLAIADMLNHDDIVSRVLSCWLCLYPRKILIEMGGYRTDIRICEDYELNFRLFKSGINFLYSGNKVVKVRNHKGFRLSRSFTEKDHIKLLSLMMESSDFLKKKYTNKESKSSLLKLACWSWSMGRNVARNKNYSCARAYFEFAQSITTRSALYNSKKIYFLYWFIDPIKTEKIAEKVKRLKQKIIP